MRNKKSQGAVEMAILVGFMLIIFSGFVVVMNMRLDSIQKQKRLNRLESVGEMVKAEVDLASVTENGYHREFEIPLHIEHMDYNLALKNGTTLGTDYSTLTISYAEEAAAEGEHTFFLPPNISGKINKGENNISKNQGTICFNQESCP